MTTTAATGGPMEAPQPPGERIRELVGLCVHECIHTVQLPGMPQL